MEQHHILQVSPVGINGPPSNIWIHRTHVLCSQGHTVMHAERSIHIGTTSQYFPITKLFVTIYEKATPNMASSVFPELLKNTRMKQKGSEEDVSGVFKFFSSHKHRQRQRRKFNSRFCIPFWDTTPPKTVVLWYSKGRASDQIGTARYQELFGNIPMTEDAGVSVKKEISFAIVHEIQTILIVIPSLDTLGHQLLWLCIISPRTLQIDLRKMLS